MVSHIELKLSQRAPKQPIRKLPPSIEVPANATVEEVKQLVARKAGIWDHNRVGLFSPTSKKTIKDRRAKISEEDGVVSAGELLVKDLGPQVAWRTVFIVEYIGPILMHVLILLMRPYIYPLVYPDADLTSLSPSQNAFFWMVMLHFIKRELETVFVHKFSANTMPAFNIVKNSAFYWLLAGLLCALHVYSPRSLAATASEPLMDYAGLVLYVFGEASNAVVHLNLAGLRTRGGTERGIPVGYGFDLVTCPNYMFEVVSWLGMILVSRSWAVALLISVGTFIMRIWGIGKEKAYRKQFGDKYKKKKYVMLPGFF